MPPRRNAYFFFMVQRRRELEAAGETFPRGLADVASRVSPEWDALTPAERAPYHKFPKQRQASGNAGAASALPAVDSWLSKRNTVGTTNKEVFEAENLRVREENVRIRDMLRLVNPELGNPLDHKIIIIHMTNYCVTENREHYVPAELGLAVFSLELGLLDNYGVLIDPESIPLGYRSEATENANRYGLPYPPFSAEARDYGRILFNIKKFMGLHQTVKGEPGSLLFCLRPDMEAIAGGLDWLCKKSGKENTFRLHPLSFLLQRLALLGRITHASRMRTYEYESIRVHDDPSIILSLTIPKSTREIIMQPRGIEEGPFRARPISRTTAHNMSHMAFPGGPTFVSRYEPSLHTTAITLEAHGTSPPALGGQVVYEDPELFVFEKQAEEFLESQDLAHRHDLACLHHAVNRDGLLYCPLNVVNRRAFNIIDILYEFFNLVPIEGMHYPAADETQEFIKRRTLLWHWESLGYHDLEGFKDSIYDAVDDPLPESESDDQSHASVDDQYDYVSPPTLSGGTSELDLFSMSPDKVDGPRPSPPSPTSSITACSGMQGVSSTTKSALLEYNDAGQASRVPSRPEGSPMKRALTHSGSDSDTPVSGSGLAFESPSQISLIGTRRSSWANTGSGAREDTKLVPEVRETLPESMTPQFESFHAAVVAAVAESTVEPEDEEFIFSDSDPEDDFVPPPAPPSTPSRLDIYMARYQRHGKY